MCARVGARASMVKRRSTTPPAVAPNCCLSQIVSLHNRLNAAVANRIRIGQPRRPSRLFGNTLRYRIRNLWSIYF